MLRRHCPFTFFFFAGAMLVAGTPLTGCGNAEAGDEGDGGAGGTQMGDGAGTGRSGSTGATGTPSATSSGEGGAAACIGPRGRGLSIEACEMTNVGLLGACPKTMADPIALEVCRSSFGVYTQGSWENLVGCLGALPATYDEACIEPAATDAVKACIDDVAIEACANPAADALCEEITIDCEANGEDFDTGACKASLAPLSDASISTYARCVGRAPATLVCGELHAHCVNMTSAP